jgi:hypothetical protein
VPRNLRRLASHEKTFVANFFAREAKRVAYTQARAEMRKGVVGGAAAENKHVVHLVPEKDRGEEGEEEEEEEERAAVEVATLEAEFRALEGKFLVEMGLRAASPEEAA